ncbi:MAG: type IV toxin-antitoxin system AbiEi family antitoxin domain-containing protein [Pseudomonadota bacterium]
MKIIGLSKINKLYFSYEDLARVLGISTASARVTASRYARQGLIVRVKRNIYVLREKLKAAGREEKFLLANVGQSPSYISLTTALDYYEITTQVQRDFIESVAVKRTKEIRLNGTVFRYTRLSSSLYFGFKKQKGVFMASPEKAFLDALYLMSFGRYSLDLSSIDTEKLDRNEIKRMIRKFPLKTQRMLKKNGYL